MSVTDLVIGDGGIAVAYLLAVAAVAVGILPVSASRLKVARWCFGGAAFVFAGFGVFWVISTNQNWPVRLVVLGLIGAAALIAFGETARFLIFEVQLEKGTAPIPEQGADFNLTTYLLAAGGSATPFGKDISNPQPIMNPVILVVRIDNVGSKASSLQLFELTATVKGISHKGKRQAIIAPITIRDGYPRILPQNDLNFRAAEGIEPGHSLAGALWFTFPDLPKDALSRANAPSFSLSFADIYSKKYVFPIETRDADPPPQQFPGISYE